MDFIKIHIMLGLFFFLVDYIFVLGNEGEDFDKTMKYFKIDIYKEYDILLNKISYNENSSIVSKMNKLLKILLDDDVLFLLIYFVLFQIPILNLILIIYDIDVFFNFLVYKSKL